MSQAAEKVLPESIEAAKPQREANPQLAQNRLKLHHEGAHREWDAYMPVGAEPKAALKESFWAHVGHLLLPGDEVRVVSDDLGFRFKVFVRAAGRNFAQVGFMKGSLSVFDAGSKPVTRSPYTIGYGGAIAKHRVLLAGNVLKDGFDTSEQAEKWAKNHEAASRR